MPRSAGHARASKRAEARKEERIILWYLSTDDRRFRPVQQLSGHLSMPNALTLQQHLLIDGLLGFQGFDQRPEIVFFAIGG